MFQQLKQINLKPKAFEFYTVKELWTDPHRAKKMMEYHLNPDVDISSRRADFIKASVNWIESTFNINQATKIADFGCGPGLYTSALAEKGAQVTGIDFSIGSLNYAKKTAKEKSLDIKYIHENYLAVDLDESYDLVIMIFCDFCALSPVQRKKLLNKFRTILKPGGSVLLDVFTPKAFANWQEAVAYEWFSENGFWSDKPHYQFKTNYK